MNDDHAVFAEWSAAYVLGALDGDDRRSFETHLTHCPHCTADLAGLAPLVGLLGKIDLDEWDSTADPARADAVVALTDADAVRTGRRLRRWQRATVGAAAVAAALLVVLLVAIPEDDPSSAMTARVDSTSLDSADVAVSPRAWGVEISLDLSGLPAEGPFELWTIDADGAWVSAATWSATPTGRVQVTGASSVDVDDLDRILVTAGDRGDPLVVASL